MHSENRREFVADTLPEAMIAMKAALGHDAILISSRKVAKNGFLGIGRREYFVVEGEVLPPWLSMEQKKEPRPMPQRRPQSSPPSEEIEKLLNSAKRITDSRSGWVSEEEVEFPDWTGEAESAGVYTRTGRRPNKRREKSMNLAERRPNSELITDLSPSPRLRAGDARERLDDRIAEIKSELDTFKNEIRDLIKKGSYVTAEAKNDSAVGESRPAGSREVLSSLTIIKYRDRLIEAGVEAELIAEITESVQSRSVGDELEDEALIRSRFSKEIVSRLRVAPLPEPPGDAPVLIAAVGPTGVGKTTTLAKLGAMLTEEEARRIACITLDFYRIGGAEQLRTYCDILGVDLEEASTPEELGEAVDVHLDKEYILIDTAGRSPNASAAIEEISDALKGSRLDYELYVFVSASTACCEMERAIKSFSMVEEARIVFTKVDEVSCWGPLFSAAARSGLGTAFITTGQGVPDDVEPASPRMIADKLLDGAETDR